MAVESNSNSGAPAASLQSPAAAVKVLVRQALKATLATLDRASGHPYGSLITIAAEVDGTPLMLISRLALHTQNLNADARGSILIDGSGPLGDPLAGGRVTLIGRAAATDSVSARARFLKRHPEAGVYVDFPDFRFFRLEIERAHFIGGFGRIVDLTADDLKTPLEGAGALIAAEDDIVAHMNADHAGALALYAGLEGVSGAAPWRMTGIDPEGCDLVATGQTVRVIFQRPIATPGEARHELARLARVARAHRG